MGVGLGGYVGVGETGVEVGKGVITGLGGLEVGPGYAGSGGPNTGSGGPNTGLGGSGGPNTGSGGPKSGVGGTNTGLGGPGDIVGRGESEGPGDRNEGRLLRWGIRPPRPISIVYLPGSQVLVRVPTKLFIGTACILLSLTATLS